MLPSKSRRHGVVFLAGVCLTSHSLNAEMRQPLTPEACTEIRRLAPDDFTSLPPLRLSPDGKHVAYVLQVPDVVANDNKDQLYVRVLTDHSSDNQSPILSDSLIAAVSWFQDNRHLAVLLRQEDKVILARIDSISGTKDVIWEAGNDITDYSMDAAGNTIAVGIRVRALASSASEVPQDSLRGYHIDLASTNHSAYPRRQIYILRLGADHHWTIAQHVTFVSPLSGKLIDSILDTHDLHISLSPDGHHLLIDNVENFSDITLTGGWATSPMVQYLRHRGIEGLLVSYLYDIDTQKVSMPLESPTVREGLWAPDSKSYVKVALAPVGSNWEADDVRNDSPSDHMTHLFSVDVSTGKVNEVLRRAERGPIAWSEKGDLITRDPMGDLVAFRKESDRWIQINTTHIPLPDAAPYSPLASDGQSIVMQYESAGTPPELVTFDLSPALVGHVRRLSKLNPEIDNYILPHTEVIHWSTSTGFPAKGLLLLPPDYDLHHRYPLVIEDGSILYSGEFVCDSGAAHVSSFARGILADAGVAYLTRYWPGINEWENNYYPKGYPGGVAEAAFKQDLVESAVNYLDQRHVIDPSKVGLIGFSRGGWYVEYALAHSHMHFQAATATDNILYSLGEYWYWHNEVMASSQEGMYGGPPYGKSLKNWLDYSISFNLDKIRTPLLMEVMGYGKNDDDPDRPPDNLAVHNEIFVGLSRLNRPVEYYYYPNEQHEPDHPQARIAGLQRNVDWFRFWLQGYERPNPQDPDQYKRWEHLRELRDADTQTQNNLSKPN